MQRAANPFTLVQFQPLSPETVAERKGTWLQPTPQRFESAQSLWEEKHSGNARDGGCGFKSHSFPSSGCSSVWLECFVRSEEGVGSNPTILTTYLWRNR